MNKTARKAIASAAGVAVGFLAGAMLFIAIAPDSDSPSWFTGWTLAGPGAVVGGVAGWVLA